MMADAIRDRDLRAIYSMDVLPVTLYEGVPSYPVPPGRGEDDPARAGAVEAIMRRRQR